MSYIFLYLCIYNTHTQTHTHPLSEHPHFSPPLRRGDASTRPHTLAAEPTHMYMPSVLNQPKRQLFKRTMLRLRKHSSPPLSSRPNINVKSPLKHETCTLRFELAAFVCYKNMFVLVCTCKCVICAETDAGGSRRLVRAAWNLCM